MLPTAAHWGAASWERQRLDGASIWKVAECFPPQPAYRQPPPPSNRLLVLRSGPVPPLVPPARTSQGEQTTPSTLFCAQRLPLYSRLTRGYGQAGLLCKTLKSSGLEVISDPHLTPRDLAQSMVHRKHAENESISHQNKRPKVATAVAKELPKDPQVKGFRGMCKTKGKVRRGSCLRCFSVVSCMAYPLFFRSDPWHKALQGNTL